MKTKKIISLAIICLILAASLMAEYVPFTVKLNMLERFVVSSFLPEKTSFANWKVINDLKMELAPTEKELKVLNLQTAPEGGVTGNWNAIPEKEITFGEVTENIVIDALKKLDSESSLLPEHISLYKKFVLKENE